MRGKIPRSSSSSGGLVGGFVSRKSSIGSTSPSSQQVKPNAIHLRPGKHRGARRPPPTRPTLRAVLGRVRRHRGGIAQERGVAGRSGADWSRRPSRPVHTICSPSNSCESLRSRRSLSSILYCTRANKAGPIVVIVLRPVLERVIVAFRIAAVRQEKLGPWLRPGWRDRARPDKSSPPAIDRCCPAPRSGAANSFSGFPSAIDRSIQWWNACTPLRSSVFSSFRNRSDHFRAQAVANSGRASRRSTAPLACRPHRRRTCKIRPRSAGY